MNFTPVVRNSNSIPKSLIEFSKDRKIPTNALDFELLSFETLIKRKGEEEFCVVNEENKISSEDLHEEETKIVQEYSISLFAKDPKQLPFKEVKLSLATNKLKTKAILTIHKGSLFHKSASVIKDFKKHIWNKKLRAGLFIGVFESNLNGQLKKFFTAIPFEKPLPKDVKLTIAIGLEPLPPRDANLIKLYEQKAKEDKENIIDGVEEGELIARYIKQKSGKDGRSCTGRYITVRAPNIILPKPIVDATIQTKEHADEIEYFAKENGYVRYMDNTLSISQTLKLQEASFRSSAKIKDDDKDISVHIEHNRSHSEDAIGSGVQIDVKELNVDGAIGANVTIATQELNVDAQTHRDAKMEVANQANVKLHRGDLSAKDAQIDMLETGKVSAQRSIHIKQMLGGEAVAPIVKVDKLLSNCIIIASEKIEIGSIEGENNKLIINPDAIESYHNDIESIKAQIKTKSKELFNHTKEFEKRYEEHLQQMERMKTFQARIHKATKAGKKPMKQDMIRIKLFKKEAEVFAQEKEHLHKQQEEIAVLEAKLQHYYEKDLHAQIIAHSSYDGHSRVIFVDLSTKEEITHLPEGKIEKISLVLNHEGKRVIKLEEEC